MNLKVVFKFKSLLGLALSWTLMGGAGAGCISGRSVPVAGPADLSRGVRRFPDLTREELASGRDLYASRCGSCHNAPSPTSRLPEEWPAEIREMKERARLNERDMKLIERYVVTMSDSPELRAGPAAQKRR